MGGRMKKTFVAALVTLVALCLLAPSAPTQDQSTIS